MIGRLIRMDGRIIAYGLLEDGVVSLPFMSYILFAQGSWWESWGIGMGGLFVTLGVTLIVRGLLRHGEMKPAWANRFMIVSLFFGIYCLVLAGIWGTGSQENLGYCGSNLVEAAGKCQAGEAQAFGGGILIVNAIGLAATFFSSWNWIRVRESTMPGQANLTL